MNLSITFSSAAPVGGSVARAAQRHPGRSIRRDTGQAKMRFAGNRQRRITCQLQDAPVGLGRQMRAGCLLPGLAQAEGRQYGGEDMPRLPG